MTQFILQPTALMIGEFHLTEEAQAAIWKVVGEDMRDPSQREAFFAELGEAIAEFHAERKVPNDEHFFRPREETEAELKALRDAATALEEAIAGLSRETRQRLEYPVKFAALPGETPEIGSLILDSQLTDTRHRMWQIQQAVDQALYALKEPRRRGPRPHVAPRYLALRCKGIFRQYTTLPIEHAIRQQTPWQEFLIMVCAQAGTSIDGDGLAHQLSDGLATH
jgi:hypothetical protein